MNLWECTHQKCEVTATGVGSAYGLLAIGWYFIGGNTLKCPAHHPAAVMSSVIARDIQEAIIDKADGEGWKCS